MMLKGSTFDIHVCNRVFFLGSNSCIYCMDLFDTKPCFCRKYSFWICCIYCQLKQKN